MRKRFGCILAGAFLLSLLVGTSTAGALALGSSTGATQGLSAAQIAQRFAQINSTYAIGQPFSAQDAAFIKAYATPAATGTITPMAQQSFSKSNTSHAVHATFDGYVTNSIGYLSFTYGGNIKCVITSGKSAWRKTTLQISCTAYGLVGSGGVGIIYDGQISSSTTTATTYTMNQSKKVSGLAAYTYTNANCVISMSSGSYNIQAF